MDKKQKKSILKEYLGFSPVWLDLRKKEILNDGIDINQWQINMNHLIRRYGTIDASERKAFEHWIIDFERNDNDETRFGDYLEEYVTPSILDISSAYLPQILYRDKDRNWFLSAYPDVFEYFYPQPNYLAEDFDVEKRRFKTHDKAFRPEHERMERYLLEGKSNQTILLLRMKKFYKNELNKDFLLSSQ